MTRQRAETAYLDPTGRLVHRYGDRVHILTDPWSLGLLGRLCGPAEGVELHGLLTRCFQRLCRAACAELATRCVRQQTRMTASEPRAFLDAVVVDPDQAVVIVDVARAGMVPSHVFQLELMQLIRPERVRVDHIYMQRVSDAQGRVLGVETAGSKIGGAVGGASVLIPDPMAATGSSMAHVLDLYGRQLEGTPRRLVLCHLIVTPEYIRRVQAEAPSAVIYALRVDRGLSAEDVLAAVPGERWDEERGLTEQGYIVPGAGGLGELINNAHV